MMQELNKDNLKFLISDYRILEAFDLLINSKLKDDTIIYNQLISLKSQLIKLKKEYRNGLVTKEEISVVESKTVVSLLEIIDELHPNLFASNQKSKKVEDEIDYSNIIEELKEHNKKSEERLKEYNKKIEERSKKYDEINNAYTENLKNLLASVKHNTYTNSNTNIIPIPLTLSQIKTGDKFIIEYDLNIICETCNGNGRYSGSCISCNGTGKKNIARGDDFGNICDKCFGSGKSIFNKCNKCNGRGNLFSKKKKLKVKIPKGVKNNQKLRISRKGHFLPNGNRSDLILSIVEKTHKTLKRVGDNIEFQLNISTSKAENGGKFEGTVLGEKVAFAIPQGVNDKSKVLIKGKGMPIFKSNSSGDLIITLNISK